MIEIERIREDYPIGRVYSEKDWEYWHSKMVDPRVEKVWEDAQTGEYILKVVCTGKYLKIVPGGRSVPSYTLNADANYPLSIEWHRLTRFRFIDKIETYYPSIYNDWNRKGWIPYYVKERKEGN